MYIFPVLIHASIAEKSAGEGPFFFLKQFFDSTLQAIIQNGHKEETNTKL